MDHDIIGITLEFVQFMYETISPQNFAQELRWCCLQARGVQLFLILEQLGPLGGGTAV